MGEMMNCKPGDLAILVECKWPENIGAIVEVLRPSIGMTEHYGRHVWKVRVTGRALTATYGLGDLPAPAIGVLNALDSQLRPISGIPVTDDVTEDLKEPA